MSLQTQPGELIDVRPLGNSLPQAKHASILEAESFKVKRMVLMAGTELPEHIAPSDILVQCLEGRFEFTSGGTTKVLFPGLMIHLTKGELHSLHALENSSFLLTIIN